MKKNVGNVDRIVRIAMAAVLAILIFTLPVTGGLGIFLSLVGGLLFLTGVAGDCPLYWLLKINTCKIRHPKGSH